MMKQILVVGGAGYIGSHMCKKLSKAGFNVCILDNLSTGFAEAVKYGELLKGDLTDSELLKKIFTERNIDCVMHFGASIEVGESVVNPGKYFMNNTMGSLNLMMMMKECGVKKLIFSSTAALYGTPDIIPIPETHPVQPINPYGKSKAMTESMIDEFQAAYGFKSIRFRYFNACGADFEGELGENHDPESHLIPITAQSVLGKRGPLKIFGTDYLTEDGSCIRDYIHVEDLCDAHLIGLNKLLSSGESAVYNLGTGKGLSVLEIARHVREFLSVSYPELKLETEFAERRPGDPASLVADPSKAFRELNWKPVHTDPKIAFKGTLEWEMQKKS